MTEQSTRIDRRAVLFVAWPVIVSNLSTPLLGLVDTAVIGNLGDAALLGAIAIGAMIFSFLYWGFGFLRMGTTGLVAQASGAGDPEEIKASLYRPMATGLLVGIVLLALQVPIANLAFALIDGSPQVESAAYAYFSVRILGAPISLLHLATVGYLLGRQKTRALLVVQVSMNGLNILLDIVFVVMLDWGVAGVAAATVIAEVVGAALGWWIVARDLRASGQTLRPDVHRIIDGTAMARMFRVNRDIMIRTLCLIFAFAWFTNQGAASGDVILAANAILMQFVSFAAFFLDGFALAAESMVGHAVGERSERDLTATLRFSAELGIVTSVILAGAFLVAGDTIIELLTSAEQVQLTAARFLPWAIAAPVISVACYLLDGIFIGATRTVAMRNAMIISLIVFLVACECLSAVYGNHGLWAALMIYFVARAASLAWYLGEVFAAAKAPSAS